MGWSADKVEPYFVSGCHRFAERVYMYVGEYETPKPGDRRYNSQRDMIADMKAFETVLISRKYRGLSVSSEVLNDEDHVTVAPRGFTHGLLKLLPVR